MELRGRVVRERVAQGSKSERNAIVLVTADGQRLHLRVRGGNPLYDPALEPYVGSEVFGEGRIVGHAAILDELPARVGP